MSLPQPPPPARLVIGVFLKEPSLLGPVADALVRRHGPPDMIGPWMAFDQTRYYEPEMGGPLRRRMFSFKGLIDQGDLPDIKRHANGLEADLAEAGRRRVNIDPGCLLAERFVLATGKNFSHRIHLDGGIYADLTLIYENGAYKALPWTYPDYGEERMRDFLARVRRRYLRDLKRFQKGFRIQKGDARPNGPAPS